MLRVSRRLRTWAKIENPHVHLGGNIGKSLLLDLPNIKPTDLVILELSSFMLEDTPQINWSPNIAVSPAFNTSLGYPQQAKMGDYNHIVSDATGADAVYTATFNGEQDVYHIRLFPDCNGNGISDVTDLQGASVDCNANKLPDECESAPVCLTAGTIPETGASRMTISKTGSDLLLRWGASCQADDPDYAIYEGTLGSFTSHVPRFCSTAGAKIKLFTPAAGSAYYLVVPTHTVGEGSYGLGNGGERPPSAAAYLPQIMGACIP